MNLAILTLMVTKLTCFLFQKNGDLAISDPDELLVSEGSKIILIFSLDDGGGKSSNFTGIINVAPQIILESNKLDDGWLESSWFGKFYNNSSNWIYHYPLGWLYLHSLHPDGFWIWDDLEKTVVMDQRRSISVVL